MRSFIVKSLLLGVFVAAPALVGCDETLKKDETVKTNADGSTSKDKTEVKRQPDGTIVKEQEHSTDNK